MRKILTLDEFNDILARLDLLYKGYTKSNEKYDAIKYKLSKKWDKKYLKEVKEELIELNDKRTKTLENYKKLYDSIFEYDLREIPASKWKGISIKPLTKNVLDLSESNINIDLNLNKIYENVIYRNCNLSNTDIIEKYKALDPEYFDDEITQKYSNSFFSKSFNKEFKKKYLECRYLDSTYMTIEDYAKLNTIELNEIEDKEFDYHMQNYPLNSFYQEIGIIIGVRLYLASKENLKIFEEIFCSLFLTNNFDEKRVIKEMFFIIRNYNLESAKELIFETYKRYLSSQKTIINLKDISKSFIDLNKDFFLLHKNIDEKVRNRYIQNEIEPYDIVNNYDVFKDIDYNYFFFSEHFNKNMYDDLNNMKEDLNVLLEAASKYEFIDYIIKKGYFKIINTIGLNNLIKFNKETSYFENNEDDIDNMFDSICRVCYKTKKSDFYEEDREEYIDDEYKSDGNIDYKTATDRLANILQHMNRLHYVSDKFIDMSGEFRKKYSKIFIDEWASMEIQKAFYKCEITPELLSKHKEDIQFLLDKDLTKILSLKWRYYESYSYKDMNTIINLMVQYYGTEKTLNLLAKYSSYLDYYSLENEDINPDIRVTEKNIRKYIMKNCLEKNRNYRLLANIEEFPKEYPDKFLNLDGLDLIMECDILDEFYDGDLNFRTIYMLPQIIDRLVDVDFNVCFRNNTNIELFDLLQIISKRELLSLISKYGHYLDENFEEGLISNLVEKKASMDEVEKQVHDAIINGILKGNILYSIDDPEIEFLTKEHPEFFIEKSSYLSDHCIDLFYRKQLSLNLFDEEPTLINHFKKTNIIMGLEKDFQWINMVIESKPEDDMTETNLKRLKLAKVFQSVRFTNYKESFIKMIINYKGNFDENIDTLFKILNTISNSNSKEIDRFQDRVIEKIVNDGNTLDNFKQIEEIYMRNNLPKVASTYETFSLLYPTLKFDRYDKAIASPALVKSQDYERNIIIFSDLLKAAMGSNNKSLKLFINRLESISKLYEKVLNNDEINDDEINEIKEFNNILLIISNCKNQYKQKNQTYSLTNNPIEDLLFFGKVLSKDGSLNYNLGDRITRMFAGTFGINTIQEAKEYMESKIKEAEKRNIKTSKSKIKIEKGDLVKGLELISDFHSILQDGCLSREYIGVDSKSDNTPFDSDVSIVQIKPSSIRDTLEKLSANIYGPIKVVLKNDDRFITSRAFGEREIKTQRDMKKMELFFTGNMGSDHYGIRTGFSSSDIYCFIMDRYNPKLGLEIALNGLYIPVANKDGDIIFTYEMYKELREKMSGLDYYNLHDYKMSNNLSSPIISETKEKIINEMDNTKYIERQIIGKIIEALNELGIKNVHEGYIDNLVSGSAEIYSTGSTNRNTNIPSLCDYDFLIKLDKKYYDGSIDCNFLERLKDKLNLSYGFNGKLVGLIKVKDLNGNKIKTDVELSFCQRTNMIDYPTEKALNDKLEAIKEQYPDNYTTVLANIVYAKDLFKKHNIYKSLKSDSRQGGLGGIGIENWILQHGGSFYDACKDFLKVSEECDSFEEFQERYQVFDFGFNHYTEKNDIYPHDNFVGDYNKMGKDAYYKMIKVMKDYVSSFENNQVSQEKTRRRTK